MCWAWAALYLWLSSARSVTCMQAVMDGANTVYRSFNHSQAFLFVHSPQIYGNGYKVKGINK